MKKILIVFLFLILAIVLHNRVEALTFEEAYRNINSKPLAVLVYAQWAENAQGCLSAYRQNQTDFVNKYNFVELDIATPDAKFFNTKYNIFPDLPYVLILKDGGKLFRLVKRDCLLDYSCMAGKLNLYAQ